MIRPINNRSESVNTPNTTLKKSLRWPLVFIFIIFIVHLFQLALDVEWGYWGIYPRKIYGLAGIVVAPLLHGDWGHVFSNVIPILALGTLIFYFYPKVAARSFWMIYLLTGITVWLMGRSVFHIGASGVVYGLVAFLLGNGIFRRNPKAIILSLIILFFYSGMFLGILPNQEGISWESHLLGGLIGFFTSFFYREEIEADEVKKVYSWELDPEEADRPYFLPRDTFDKTKWQRQQEARQQQQGWTQDDTLG